MGVVTDRQRSRILRNAPTAAALLIAVVVGALVVMEVGGAQAEARDRLTAEANATYGEGNWTWQAIECGLSCAHAPRAANASVPNASVLVGPTEEDVETVWERPGRLLAPVGIAVGLGILGAGVNHVRS